MRVAAVVLILSCLTAGPARARDESLDGVTAGVLIGVSAGLIVYDVHLALSGNRTESMVVRDAAWRANVLPYMAGALAAHVFLTREKPPNLWMVGLATVPIVVTYDLLCHGAGRVWWRHPALAFGVGFGVGALTWSQAF